MSTNETEVAKRVLPLIDLTLLGTNDTIAEVEALCDSAATPFGNVAAVCVWPEFVEAAVARLAGAGIDVAAVANFPEGDNNPGRAIADSKHILEQGGREVDVVFPGDRCATGSWVLDEISWRQPGLPSDPTSY